MKKILNKIVLLMVALLMPVQSVLAVTINSLKYNEGAVYGDFDIYGKINGDSLMGTSFAMEGYTVLFKAKDHDAEEDTAYNFDRETFENQLNQEYEDYIEQYKDNADFPKLPVEPEEPDISFMNDNEEAANYFWTENTYVGVIDKCIELYRSLDDQEAVAKLENYKNWIYDSVNYMIARYQYINDVKAYINRKRAEDGIEPTHIDINSQEILVRYLLQNGEVTKNGVKLKLKGIETSAGNAVRVEYTITNTSDVKKDYKTATVSDIMFSFNDRAAMVKDGRKSIVLTQDSLYYYQEQMTYGAQLYIDFETEATTSWIGNYRQMFDNRYVDGTVTSISSATDNIDTGLAYSWSGTLDPGESVTKVAIFSVKNAPMGKVNLFKKGNTTGVPDEVLERVIGGAFIVPTNDTGEWVAQVDGEVVTLYSDDMFLFNNDVLNLYEPTDEITAIGFDGEYDGEEHFVTILGTLPGDTVTYSTDGVNYSSTVPKYSELGEYTTYYKVERSGEEPVTGSSTIKISPKVLKSEDITIDIGNPEKEYTGSAIEPEVTVKHNSTVVPSSEYDVTYDNNTEIGVASVIVSDKEGGNYIIEDTTSYFEIVAPGKVNVIEPSTPNSYSGSFAEAPILVKSKIELTDAEKQKLIDGKNMDIYLEVKDISDSISKEEKNKIDKKLSKGDTVGLYLDVSLFKKFDGENPEKINSTKKPIKITFEIPEKLRKEGRKFVIYRYHNGTVTELNVTVEGNYATFETDEFSSFALAYNDSNETSNPKTGDNIIYYVGVLVLSLVGLVYFKRKRIN